MKKIIIDTYGADAGPAPIIEGALDALAQNPELSLILAGNREQILQYAAPRGMTDRIEIMETDDYITNDEAPTVIFGGRDRSSLALSLDRLKSDEETIGLLTAGNTGAVLVGSICRLGLLAGLRTPALASYLPLDNGDRTCLVDCGANTSCTAKDLARFALMGTAFRQSMAPDASARVALLSVGREDGKGNALTLEAFGLLKELPIDFIGNMEGSDFVSGYADVIVSDGFAGNILLKSIESAGLAARRMADEIAADHPMAAAIHERLTDAFDFNTRGGATFLGTKKPIIKMHGCAVRQTPAACIDQLLQLEKADFIPKLKSVLS